MKMVFTTGQVAKICRVAARTVSKWFDSGRLKGYRIPGSQDRRIPREHLVSFMKEYGFVLGDLADEELYKILLVSMPKNFLEAMATMLPQSEHYEQHHAGDTLEFAWAANNFGPDAIIVDCSIGTPEAKSIAKFCKAREQFDKTMFIAIGTEDATSTELLTQAGYHLVFCGSVCRDTLVKYIRQSAAAKRAE